MVVNEACDDDDMVGSSGQVPRVRPNSPWRGLEPSKGSALDQSTPTLKNGMVVIRVQGFGGLPVTCFVTVFKKGPRRRVFLTETEHRDSVLCRSCHLLLVNG